MRDMLLTQPQNVSKVRRLSCGSSPKALGETLGTFIRSRKVPSTLPSISSCPSCRSFTRLIIFFLRKKDDLIMVKNHFFYFEKENFEWKYNFWRLIEWFLGFFRSNCYYNFATNPNRRPELKRCGHSDGKDKINDVRGVSEDQPGDQVLSRIKQKQSTTLKNFSSFFSSFWNTFLITSLIVRKQMSCRCFGKNFARHLASSPLRFANLKQVCD